MKDYCADILEQMGYHVVNPNQKEISIIDKKTFEPLAKIYDTNDPFFRINKNSGSSESICFYENDYTTVRTKDLEIRIGNQGSNLEYATYSVEMYADSHTLKLVVRQFLERDFNDFVGDIGVYVTDAKTNGFVGSLDINQYSNYCQIDWDSEEKELRAGDYKTSTIMSIIMDFLKGIKVIEESKKMQEGLKYLLPSFTKAVNNMFEYWKDYAVPKEIIDREKKIAEYQKQIATLNTYINFETDEIKKLNRTLENVGKKDAIRKR